MELCSLALALVPSPAAAARTAPSAQDTVATQDAIGVRLLASVLPDDWLEPARRALIAPQAEDQDLELPSAGSSPLLWASPDEDLAAPTAEEFAKLAALVPATTRILVLANADLKATLRAVGAAGHAGLTPALERAFAGSDPKTTLDQALDDPPASSAPGSASLFSMTSSPMSRRPRKMARLLPPRSTLRAPGKSRSCFRSAPGPTPGRRLIG